MFDTISAIDNHLREKSVISAIYRGNIGSMAHARVSLTFR